MSNMALGLQPLAFQPTSALAVPGISPNPYGIRPLLTAPPAPEPSAPSAARRGVAALASASAPVTRAVKTALHKLGFYDGTIDNREDGVYRRSILAFQREHKLPQTGKANAATRRAMSAELVKKAQQQPDARQQLAAPAAPHAQLAPAAIAAAPQAMLGASAPIFAGAPGVPGVVDPGMGIAPAGQPNGPQVNQTQQQGLGTSAAGNTQTVENRNEFDSSNRQRHPYGAYGQAGFPYADMTSPVGYPYVGWQTPGAGGGISGFFRGLFG